MIVEETQGYCRDCHTIHPAWIERQGRDILFRTQCNKKSDPFRISTDADLYLRLREKSTTPRHSSQGYHWINLLEVTKACNFQCPICYASALPSTDPTEFKSVDDIVTLGKQLKTKGIRTVCVTGGEPTLHPDCQEIVASLNRLGLRVNMATNGYRLGTEPLLAQQLKSKGLSTAFMQLDTFDKQVHFQLRGNDTIETKKKAVQNALAARIRLGLIGTVTRANLMDVGNLLDYALERVPGMHTLTLQCAAETGRYDCKAGHRVCREEVIDCLVQSKVVPGVSTESFWPVPSYKPWKLAVHPDCCAVMILLKWKGQVIPLEQVVDMERLYALLHANNMETSFYSKNLEVLKYLLCCAKPSRRIHLLRALYGMTTGRSEYGILFVLVEQFMHRDYMDMKRLQRCSAQVVDQADSRRSVCMYDLPDSELWRGDAE